MEEEADAPPAEPEPEPAPKAHPPHPSRPFRLDNILKVALAALAGAFGCAPGRPVDGLAHVKETGVLTYGSDKEGGGPYVYPDPKNPRELTGFEVELVALLAGELG